MKPSAVSLNQLVPAWWPRIQRETQQSWSRLAPREQRLLSLCGVIVLLAIIWLVLLEPAWNTVRRLNTAMPQLHAQAAQLDAILSEARELQGQAGQQQLTAQNMPEEITASLQRAGLADFSSLAPEPIDGPWRIDFEAAPVAATFSWLQSLPFELRLRTTELELQRSLGPEGRQLAGRLSGHLMVDSAQEQGS